MDKIRLTQYSRYSGCGAKLGPCALNKALGGLKQPEYLNLIAGYEHSEDAGVYKINDDTAIVQTVDFFPPIVDDPYQFGQIAAANALSDVYAMGGTPITALSIVGFPTDKLDMSVLRAIMDGGLSKLKEAGAALLGGHSINDSEVKYGLAITGLIHPDKIYLNNTPIKGDKLVLTKPLGNGTINTALKAEMVKEESLEEATRFMVMLNKQASEIAADFNISACTDITGFGLLGHLKEMLAGTELCAELEFSTIPTLPYAMEYIRDGLVPGGTMKNRSFCEELLINRSSIEDEIVDLICDPQTSGGLLYSVSPDHADQMVTRMNNAGIPAAVIGEITIKEKGVFLKT